MKKLITYSLSLLLIPVTFAQGIWTQKADYTGDPRTAACGFVIGTGGYLGCGFDSASFRRSFMVYVQAQNNWISITSMGGVTGSGLSRDAAVAFSIGSKGYVGTGQGSIPHLNDFWEYNSANDVWTQKTNFPGTARRKSVGFAVGSKGYIGLGQDALGFKNDMYEYNPATNLWITKASFIGTARQLASVFVIGTDAYVGSGDDGINKADFYKFNTLLNTWSAIASFPGLARKGACAFAINGIGYFGTGYDNSLSNVADFWKYYPATNSWSSVASFGGGARSNMVAFAIGNQGYAGTGYEGTVKKDFWEFSPPLGIEEEQALVFSVYPNPVIESSTLNFAAHLNNAELRLMNMQGQLLREEIIDGRNWTLERGTLKPGTYFLEITEGNAKGVRKIVVL